MAAEDLLVHVHIEKTAGTALADWFRHAQTGGHALLYPRVPSSFYLDEGALQYIDLIADTRVRSVSSHYFRVFPERVRGRRMRYFTLLREPVSQYLSFCNYERQLYPTITDPEQLAELPPNAHQLSAREFTEWLLDQPDDIPFRENYQTNYLTSYVWRTASGRGPRPVTFEPQWDHALASHVWRPASGPPPGGFKPRWDAADWKAYRSERVPLGKQLLGDFAAVGIVERMHDSLALLAKRAAAWGLQLGPLDRVERVNVTPELQQDLRWIDRADSVGRRLLEALEDDRELHAFAGQLLDASLRADIPGA